MGTTANPNWSLGADISPYLHLGPNGFVPPLPPDDGICPDVSFGTETFCLVPDPIETPEQDECSTVKVDYELIGIEGTGVKVKAFPTTKGELDDGTLSFRAAIEGEGPRVTVRSRCLTPGLTYNVVVDVVGDAGGAIGSSRSRRGALSHAPDAAGGCRGAGRARPSSVICPETFR